MGGAADTQTPRSFGAVRGLKNRSAKPGWPRSQPLPHSTSMPAGGLHPKNCCNFACCVRSTEAWRRRREVPQKQRFGVRAWVQKREGCTCAFINQ